MFEPTDLRRHVRAYPGAVDDALIGELLALPGAVKMDEDWRRCSVTPVAGDVLQRFVSVVHRHFVDYRELSSTLNFCTLIEAPNVLRYGLSSPDRPEWFHGHADAWDVASATRQVSVIAYLNDVAQGGQTVFDTLGFSQRCDKGTLLFFPANYLYPHTALPPESGEKVVVVTWIHFGINGVPSYRTVPFG